MRPIRSGVPLLETTEPACATSTPRFRNVPVAKLTRDGHVVSTGPVRKPLSVASLVARDTGMILFVAGCVTVVVALAAGDGFEVSVPVQSVEEDDAPRGDAW